MATIKNARDVLLQDAATRLDPVDLPGNVSVPWPNVTGVAKPADYADVTTSILTASGTSIVMNNANLFKSNSGAGGVFIGSGGLFGKNSSGVETFAIDASTGAARFKGDIDTTGLARFGGANSQGGFVAAVIANASSASFTGILAYGGGDAAIRADGQSTSHGVAATANSSGKAGISALSTHASGYAGTFVNNNGGTALAVDTGSYSSTAPAIDCYGRFYLSNHAFVWNGYVITPPTGGTDVLRKDGTWGTAGTATYAATAGEVSISSQANVTSTSGNAALRSVGTNYQAVQQTDGNFVVYNMGSPIGSATGGFPSDRRLKEDIAPTAVDSVGIVKALRVVDYRWKADAPQRAHRPGLLTGFIAQEVAEIFAQAVSANRGQDGDAEQTLLLTPTDLIAPMVAALQHVLARVEALEQA